MAAPDSPSLPPHFPTAELVALRAQIAAAPQDQESRLWRDATLGWAESLSSVLTSTLPRSSKRAPYRVDTSERMIVVSALPESVAAKWPPFGELVLDTVLPFLDPIDVRPPWPTVICLLHDVPTFDAYLRSVAPDTRLVPAGCYIDDKGLLPHIAILGTLDLLQLRLVFTHELIHARIHRPGLPLWIEEGICHHLQMNQLRLHLVYLNNVDLRRNHYWRENNLTSFWAGTAWGAHGELAPYLLANRIVRRLLSEGPERFFAFTQQARAEDAGDAAARAVYGRSILDIAREFLGAGDWLPPGAVPQA